MPEKQQPASVQERIVLATIACIERLGMEATGIREIAREAGVNSAAINYYFRSKERLLEIVLERTLDTAFSEVLTDFDRALAEGAPPLVALRRVLDDFVRDAPRFPRIAYAHMRAALVEQDYSGPAVAKLGALLTGLSERLAPALPHLSEEARRIALSQMWAALLMLGLLPKLFTPFARLDLEDPEQRGRYVERLLAGLS